MGHSLGHFAGLFKYNKYNMGHLWATHWATSPPIYMYKCIPPLLSPSPNPSFPHPADLPPSNVALSIGAAIVLCHVVPLLVWCAVPLFMRGMCVRTLLSSSSLPLSRWEGRDKKDPAWLFDHFKVNDFGNP